MKTFRIYLMYRHPAGVYSWRWTGMHLSVNVSAGELPYMRAQRSNPELRYGGQWKLVSV
jgi:hypothetical protein